MKNLDCRIRGGRFHIMCLAINTQNPHEMSSPPSSIYSACARMVCRQSFCWSTGLRAPAQREPCHSDFLFIDLLCEAETLRHGFLTVS